jgi:hypothetical protein
MTYHEKNPAQRAWERLDPASAPHSQPVVSSRLWVGIGWALAIYAAIALIVWWCR